MVGLAILAPGAVAPADVRLSVGSVLLSYPGHSTTGWPAGIPANGVQVPNVAAASAKTLLGTSADADVNPITHFGSIGSGFRERTSKGGIHVVVPSATAPATTGSGQIVVPTAMRTWMLGRLTDRWYVSTWYGVTRAATATDGVTAAKMLAIGNTASSINNYLSTFSQTSPFEYPASGAKRLGGSPIPSAPEPIGTYRRSIGVNGFTGAVPAIGGFQVVPFSVGQSAATVEGQPMAVQGSTPGQPSLIHYCTYVENLTVSGRSYAEVEDLDLFAYNLAFGAGGTYFGDTHAIDPAVAVA